MFMTQAAVARVGQEDLVIETVALQRPLVNEVLVEISAVGICHTDVAALKGQLPIAKPVVLGHEGCGRVLEVGAGVSRIVPGDRVVISFASCGECRSCDAGAPAYCRHFRRLNFAGIRKDGSTPLTDDNGHEVRGQFFGQSSFARHSIVSERNLVRIPEFIEDRIAAPMGCAIQTGAGAIINSLKVGAGASLVVSGVGSVGLAAIATARAVGATTIVAVDIYDHRLALAAELGATLTINARDQPIAEARHGLIDGLDFALDTTGNESVIACAALLVRPGGKIGLVSFSGGATSLDYDLLRGRTFVGIIEGHAAPQAMLPVLFDMFERGLLPIEKLVSVYPFVQINEAMHDMEAGKVIKPVLQM